MAEVKSHKVKQLASRLDPNAIYWVQASANLPIEGFITDVNGVPYPLKDLQGSGGITTLTNTDGNLVITGADNKVINIAPALLSVINSALQSGNNISELINNAGYITSADLPTKTSDLTNDGEDSTSTYVEQDDLDLFLQRKQNLPTGFITGLQLSINADPTKIDIAPGAYAISDFADLNNITVQIIQIINPITGITPAYLNTGNISYIAIDINQNIIQSSSPFTNEQRRTLAILGAAIHSNLINVNVVNEIKAPIVAPTNQLHDLMRAIGSFNLEGNIYSSNGANLQLNKSAGAVFGLGINANNYLNPHQLSIASQTGLTFRYRLQTGTEYSNTTLIDPANYDNGGVLTPLLNNNKWQVQRINLFQSGLTRIQPGQFEYDSLEDAEANIKVESFITETNIAENAIFRSYLIVKKNATDLSNPAQAKFIPVDKFGNVITGNTALTYANIVSALGFTPEDVANKATDFSVINDIKYPSIEAVKEQLDLKLSNNIASYSDVSLPLVDTDQFIVERGGTFYKVDKSELAGTSQQIYTFEFSQPALPITTNWQVANYNASKYNDVFRNNTATTYPTLNTDVGGHLILKTGNVTKIIFKMLRRNPGVAVDMDIYVAKFVKADGATVFGTETIIANQNITSVSLNTGESFIREFTLLSTSVTAGEHLYIAFRNNTGVTVTLYDPQVIVITE